MTKPLEELDDVLADLETLLKNPDVGAALADKGVNISLAILAMDGLAAYLHGDKAKAVDDSSHFAEEVQSRMRTSAMGKPS
ncbi:MAG TPA: hypothetical protein VLM85_04920 [Polyangiaceae bacterium]|nr:hypothetical protein [Polyangiaceae bacterium]